MFLVLFSFALSLCFAHTKPQQGHVRLLQQHNEQRTSLLQVFEGAHEDDIRVLKQNRVYASLLQTSEGPIDVLASQKLKINFCIISGCSLFLGTVGVAILPPLVGFGMFWLTFFSVGYCSEVISSSTEASYILGIAGALAFFVGYGLVYSFAGAVNKVKYNLNLAEGRFASFMQDVPDHYVMMGMWIVALGLFHLFEFIFVMFHHPDDMKVGSFLINHSSLYVNGHAICLAEFILEFAILNWYGKGHWKANWMLVRFGALMTGLGLLLRIIAMHTAQHNFTLMLAFEQVGDHELVTTGVYSLFRHPAYVGWHWYCVGTQVMLCNPICFVAFFYLSYQFFADRIPTEEKALRHIFGKSYEAYQQKVGSGFGMLGRLFGNEALMN